MVLAVVVCMLEGLVVVEVAVVAVECKLAVEVVAGR